MVINYQAENQRLESFVPSEGGDFWKPTPGQHKVKALSDLEEAEPYQDGDEKTPQAKFSLLIDENSTEKVWTIPIGKSKASIYGQLVKFAVANGGTLKNKKFMIVVTNDGKKNSYALVTM